MARSPTHIVLFPPASKEETNQMRQIIGGIVLGVLEQWSIRGCGPFNTSKFNKGAIINILEIKIELYFESSTSNILRKWLSVPLIWLLV